MKNLSISKQINIWLAMILFLIALLSGSALISIEGLWSIPQSIRAPLTVRHEIGDNRANVSCALGFETALRQESYLEMLPYLDAIKALMKAFKKA